MKRRNLPWSWIIAGGLVVGIVLVLILALLFSGWLTVTRLRPRSNDPPETAFESNGASIYYTGYNEAGERIPFTGGPHWLEVHGGGCAECHGPEGEGGQMRMMTLERAPNIQYEHLTEEMGHDEGEEHPPYTEATLRRAITEGVDPAGERLDPLMPRWQMSEEELDDIIEFLHTLGEGEHEE